MASLVNYSQQQDLLDEYTIKELWLAFDRAMENDGVSWSTGLGAFGKEVLMAKFLSERMPGRVFKLIMSFALNGLHPIMKIPWNVYCTNHFGKIIHGMWIRSIKTRYPDPIELVASDAEDYANCEDSDDEFDRPYCHSCGNLNERMIHLKDGKYKSSRYERNRSRMCEPCRNMKVYVRFVNPGYKVVRMILDVTDNKERWCYDENGQSEVFLKYCLMQDSKDWRQPRLLTRKTYSDNMDNRMLIREVNNDGFCSIRVMKVSCNYRTKVRGRKLIDSWHPTLMTDRNGIARQYIALRRVYVINQPSVHFDNYATYIYEAMHIVV